MVYLHTSIVAKCNILNKGSESNYYTSTLVSAHKRELCCQWPITIYGMEIGMAYSGVLDVDENLIRARLLDWDLLVDDG
jgi:hypothetical protein